MINTLVNKVNSKQKENGNFEQKAGDLLSSTKSV